MKLFIVPFAFLLSFVHADGGRSVYELSYADDLEEIIEVDSIYLLDAKAISLYLWMLTLENFKKFRTFYLKFQIWYY